ncbi:MAG: chemotaxis protein CheX [Phycisphaerae bacterium]|nr:chemotaxis protein CheX [Phycisphaerae bacterium]
MGTAEIATATKAEHIECVAEATTEIFNITCGLAITPLDKDENLSGDGVIIAIISLVGDVEWSVFLGLPRQTATAIAAKFAGFEIPFDSEDMGDAIGELANILGGQVKALLDRRSVEANISLPSVMRAENMHVLIQRSVSGVKTCFDSELGKLWTGAAVGNGGGVVV